MAKNEKLITGVDIGSHAVKICQLQKSGRTYKLLAVGSAAISPGAVEDGVLQEPEEVGRTISALLKNLRIKNTKIGISISGYSVIVKKINLEAMDDDSLAEYIKAEAEQYIPFDLNDVYLDFQKLPSKKEHSDRNDIMLVAAKKEVVNDYLDMLNEIKLKTVLVDVDGFALENIWETISEPMENVALVDIGASKMNINIISEGVSVLARDIVVGSEQLTMQLANTLDIDYAQAEKIKLGIVSAENFREDIEKIFNQTCTQWVLEIKKAIDLYLMNNPDKHLKYLVLSGGGSKVNGLKEYIEKETGLSVIAFNPFKKMVYDPKKFDENYLDSIAPEMAIAAGLAIRSASF
ncbi:type IV pilus assembly protein PilM [Desulfobulbus propionicus DSM 2032]|jgi:type IV pilus assembly protein PilM|uniref:Type IV pilus assembly protein PilM n=1 Tax=Desulfobulbus propionicus (strain ATCC 33891 / DSM 2032 / VKM B-1956 / 1pr3) TaxID=577650 RepID=A0A7U3YPU4_DESPD|nr:type IV pilus assembly protein PilM [Desulfobulbus propionicus]ADW19349.1 type IV pilus assembly protein PilM [Desulfobulbus propionicus DSM 2032]